MTEYEKLLLERIERIDGEVTKSAELYIAEIRDFLAERRAAREAKA